MRDESRVWIDPRDHKDWRIERVFSPPRPYREAGSPQAERLAVPTIRFLHPAAPDSATEWVTALRPVHPAISNLSEQEIQQLLDEARSRDEM